MKKMIMVLAAAMVTASIPALASVHASQGHDAQCARDCQMLLKECGRQVDSIQQRISRLSGEIAKGASTYSQEELGILEGKLQDTQRTLSIINAGG